MPAPLMKSPSQCPGSSRSSIVIPATPRARAKFEGAGAAGAPSADGGYSVRGARTLTQWVVAQLLEHLPDLTEAERRQLARTSPHALRHTLGSGMVAHGTPLDVVRDILGHASIQTTSIYVTAEEKRRRHEAAQYFARHTARARMTGARLEFSRPR